MKTYAMTLWEKAVRPTLRPMRVGRIIFPILYLLVMTAISASVYGAGETPWCWGRNQHGQIGNNTTINQHRPVSVVGLSDVIKFDGVEHSIALKGDGTVWGWGQRRQWPDWIIRRR